MKAPLILVGNRIGPDGRRSSAQQDNGTPRRDYWEIAQRVKGSLVGYDLLNATWYLWMRQIETLAKFDFLEATVAFNRRTRHNAIFSTSEKMAIPLSMLLSICKQKVPHVVVVHKLSSAFKSQLFRAWPLQDTFSSVISVCRAQAQYAIAELGIPAAKVHFVYHNVDQRFFRPLDLDSGNYIVAVGREQRDYETLLHALAGTGLDLVVVASSPWSSTNTPLQISERVTITGHISYQALRELYAAARLVVLPLHDVPYAAGSTALLEAMAMGKPVIVTRSQGLADYLVDGQTGVYVTPHNPSELRDAILSLWDQAAKRTCLGCNARQAVEENMTIDLYVDRVATIIEKAMHTI
jgi:glycosyltransferase involved in cell wall biosynthesis